MWLIASFAACDGVQQSPPPQSYETSAQALCPVDAGNGETDPAPEHRWHHRSRRRHHECPDGSPFNACGHCSPLEQEPGDVCGRCGIGTIACDGDDGVFCSGDEPDEDGVLCAVADEDTYVRAERRNRNYGTSRILRVRRTGNNRALLYFDTAALEDLVAGQPILAARLELAIDRNDRRWGRQGRTVDIHALTVPWAELNATWACAFDTNPRNWRRDCRGADRWEMARPNNPELHPWVETPTDTVQIDNHSRGVVSFDVTEDLLAILAGERDNYGWIVRKTLENRSGRIDLGSSESYRPPVLLIEVETCGELNACGGCEPLDPEPGDQCGPCDLDLVICDGPEATVCDGDTPCPAEICDNEIDDDRDELTDCDDPDCDLDPSCHELECFDGLDNDLDALTDCHDPDCSEVSEVNDCGGCAVLTSTPGDPCGSCYLDVIQCVGLDETECSGDTRTNDCGGCDVLPEPPGSPCGPCGQDEYVCDGPETTVCEGATTNSCGGCEPLDPEPGAVCGPCDLDAVVCDGTDATTCDGTTTVNVCGGCGTLAVEPGSACGPCGLDAYICDGTEATVCNGSTTANACGGCGELPVEPGTICGPCSLDAFLCTTTETTACGGATAGNACGGCDALENEPGAACGPCGLDSYQCIGTEVTACDGATDGNACGGCEALPHQPGDSCGDCGAYHCDGAEGVACIDPGFNECGTCDITDICPPDPPVLVPEPIDDTGATDFAEATSYIYSGDNAVQTGMAPGTVDPARIAIIRGRVLDRSGAPVPGVSITTSYHPEYGSTLSRADGYFDLAVNAGLQITLRYELHGYLPVERYVTPAHRDWVHIDDVVLVPHDASVTVIDLNDTDFVQVAESSVVTDADGVRQARLLFPAGTTATMHLPSGENVSLSQMTMRATEATVGETGLAAMPGPLPANTMYTYAVDLNADEAVAAGADRVSLDRPIYHYLENFLGFVVGANVPAAYYDQDLHAWIPSDNGRVIEILDVDSQGRVEVDITGDGLAADAAELAALGFSDDERRELALLYSVGDTLWRTPIDHFTYWDLNWVFAALLRARLLMPVVEDLSPKDAEKPTNMCGSIIGTENQSVGECVPVDGTGIGRMMCHFSDRSGAPPPATGPEHLALGLVDPSTPFREVDFSRRFRINGGELPEDVTGILVEVEIHDQQASLWLDELSGVIEVAWDGRTADGRRLHGMQPMTVRVAHAYDVTPVPSASFGVAETNMSEVCSVAGGCSRTGNSFFVWTTVNTTIGQLGAEVYGLSQWSFAGQNLYDPVGRRIHYGSGGSRSASAIGPVVTTFAGSGSSCCVTVGKPATQSGFGSVLGVVVGPDENVYIASASDGGVIHRVDADGIVHYFMGGLGNSPLGMTFGPDGSMYVSAHWARKVLRRWPDGHVSVVAGNGYWGTRGDGGPATEAELAGPGGIAVAPDGTIYFTEGTYTTAQSSHRIRRVTPDGIISSVAGHTAAGFSGDGGLATLAQISYPTDIVLAPDGTLYFTDLGNNRVRRITPDGIISTYAGNGAGPYNGDDIPATSAGMAPASLALAPDGSLYISDIGSRRIRRVRPDGIIETVAGTGTHGFSGEWGPPEDAMINDPLEMDIAPDGSIYFVDHRNYRVRQIHLPYPSYSTTGFEVPSEDGGVIYRFDSRGRHLQTLDSLLRVPLQTFHYDGSNLLTAIEDRDGLQATIERLADGRPSAVVGPYGQRTELTVNGDGRLTVIENALSERYTFTYGGPQGQLDSMTTPRNNTHTFTYDTFGRLERDSNPAGGYLDLDYTPTPDGWEVSVTSAEGRERTFAVERPAAGEEIRRSSSAGRELVNSVTSSTREFDHPDGTTILELLEPDPFLGMAAPYVTFRQETTPAGSISVLQRSRSGTFDFNDPSKVEFLETEDRNGHVFTRRFEGETRTWLTTSAEGREANEVVDELGRIVQRNAPFRPAEHFSYDGNGRVESVSVGEGENGRRTWEMSYYPLGDPAGGLLQAVAAPLLASTDFQYDAAGRVKHVSIGGHPAFRLSYDDDGNITDVVPPDGSTYTFGYNQMGQMETHSAPNVALESDTTEYGYDLEGNLTSIATPNDVLWFGYAGNDRLTDMTSSLFSALYFYDEVSGMPDATITDHSQMLDYEWDYRNLVKTTWRGDVNGSVDRVYDNNNRATQVSLNGLNSIDYIFDGDGLVTVAGDMTITRFEEDGMEVLARLGSVTTSESHNSNGELVRITAEFGGTEIYSAQYQRDALGRIVEIAEVVEGVAQETNYEYDDFGRLSHHYDNGILVSRYVYDRWANRIGVAVVDAPPDPMERPVDPGEWVVRPDEVEYDDRGRLVRYGNSTYEYTRDDRLLSRSTGETDTRFTYDYFGNLHNVTEAGQPNINYTLDGEHRRVGKRLDGVVVQQFLYHDELNPIAELDGEGHLRSRFVFATRPNVPDYMINEEGIFRIVSDHLGSPRFVVNVLTGEIVQRIEYGPFGEVREDTSPGTVPFGFAGGLVDHDTGLVRFGARDYEPGTGRWTTADRAVLVGTSNTFVYSEADPVNSYDIYGETSSAIPPVSTCLLGVSSEVLAGCDWRTRPDSPWPLDQPPFNRMPLPAFVRPPPEREETPGDARVCDALEALDRLRGRPVYDDRCPEICAAANEAAVLPRHFGQVICSPDGVICPCIYPPYPEFGVELGDCPHLDAISWIHEWYHFAVLRPPPSCDDDEGYRQAVLPEMWHDCVLRRRNLLQLRVLERIGYYDPSDPRYGVLEYLVRNYEDFFSGAGDLPQNWGDSCPDLIENARARGIY